MIDTLYVSDMDGTLLDGNAALREPAREKLRRMLEAGLPFTVATARSPHSAVPILDGLPLALPAILHNGAVLYDLAERKPVYIASLPAEQALRCVDVFEANGLLPKVYTYDEEGAFHIYYRLRPGGYVDSHHGVNIASGDARYRRIDDFSEQLARERCFFISTSAERDRALPASDILAREGLPFGYYDDTYDSARRFLECYTMDKGAALRRLAAMTGAARTVAFGDGLNDIAMLRAADRAVTVEGACEEARAAADEVIGPCEEQSVVKYLAQHWSLHEV